ncbi:hypothetical protein [Niallia sp. NCCP-28]|uniref:hypothetical protein n=1 Tax=Niallia sp. NCCP-28 TaxID=2934712 RepID=UPI00208311DC|nr:hypothetical protein [Niallia sp. NCCP-28]GKU81618.1 hypothetical protein NCCP28_10140 [Niallia sp. NCCP-28]
MNNTHLTGENQDGMGLFEFEEPKIAEASKVIQRQVLYTCFISEDLKKMAEEIKRKGDKKLKMKYY